MKTQRKWRRAWLRGKPHWARNKHRPKAQVIKLHNKQRPFVKDLFKTLRPVAASVAMFSLLGMQQLPVMANQIITDGKTATTITAVNGQITDITTATQSASGNIGFNSFHKFNIDSGNTVNLQLGDANNLINFVNDTERSTIYGALNSIKNGTIGGNVYFLNPHGLLVGTGGAVNVGSFTVMTPTKAFMGTFSPTDAFGNIVINGPVPINGSGIITVQGKINALNGIKLAAHQIEHSGTLFTGAHFTATTNFSSVVNDHGLVGGTEFAVAGGNIEIVASKISATSGSLITAKGYKGEVDGNISLVATTIGGFLNNGTLTHDASVSLANATLRGKDITLTATTHYTDDAFLGFALNKSAATIDLKDSRLTASGDVKMNATVAIDVLAKTPSFMAKLTGDSALAGAVVDSTARVKLDGATDIQALGDVGLTAQNTINLAVTAKAADNNGESGQTNGGNNAGGGSLGFAIVTSTTEAGLAGQAKISQSRSIAIKAASANKITTATVSSVKGSQAQDAGETSETQKKLTKYQDDAQTSEGGITVAAALAINDITSSTKAYMESTETSTATGSIAVTSKAVNQSSITADGSAVESGATGVGVAIGINKVASDNQAYVNQKVTTKDLSVQATMNGTDANSLTTKVTSGAGATNVGVAGALAVNVHVNESSAQINGSGNIQAETVSIIAENKSTSTTSALPSGAASGDKVGVGASIATNIGINHVTAEIANGAKISGAKDITLTASGKHSLETEAKAGSKGGISVTPVVAITIADNQAIAKIGTGDTVNLTGNISVKADNTGSSKTKAEGQAEGEKAAIGAAVAINIAVDQAEAMTARSISAGGKVGFQADNASASETVAIASAAGGKAAKDDGTAADGDKSVDEKNAEQIDKAGKKKSADGKAINTKTSSAANTALDKNNAPKAETSEGSVSVAAAVGLNVGTASAKAYTVDGANVTASDKLSIKTSNNNAAAVQAEGKAVQADKDGNKVGIAAAVAVNVTSLTNTAKLGAANHSANGIEITAAMRDIGTVAKPDRTNNLTATATSGAGASKVGIAGSLALNVITNTTGAEIAGGAAVNANSGDVTLSAEQINSSEAKALPGEKGASGGTVGIGASVAINIITDTTKARVHDNAGLTNAGAVKVTAAADHDTTTEATGGAAGGVAIDAVVAVTTLNQTTQATIDTIDTGSALNAASVEVRASNTGDHKATATGDVKSSNVGIGASAAVITSNALSSATIKRDIAATGDITIAADAKRTFEAVAEASAKGTKARGDGEATPANPKNTSEKTLSDTGDKQKGTQGGKKVDIAAAVGVSVIDDNVEAGISGGSDTSKRNISTDGKLNVAATNQSDFSSRGSGAALDPQAKAGIGVGVGLSIVSNDTTANIGDNTIIKAAYDMSLAAKSLQNTTPDFVNKLAAEGIAGAGGDKVGVAGALAVSYSEATTAATIGNKVTISGQGVGAAGNIAVTVDNISKLSAKAWSAAKGGTAGVGASVATIVSENEYTASIGEDGDIKAAGLSVQAQNHKVTGGVPFVFNTDPKKLKESLDDYNLQLIFGQNNYYTEAIAGAASSNVAVTGATAVNYFQDKTTAQIGSGTDVATSGAVNLASSNDTSAKAFVTSVAVSTGNAGVGLVSTNVINSSETTSTLAGEIDASGSVSVTAKAKQDTGVFGLGGGVANTAGVSGVATVAVSKNTVTATIANNAKAVTTGSILVDAQNDFNALNIAASVAVGGTAGVGAAIGTTNVQNDTQASIGKKAVTNAGQDTSIIAAATETLHTIAAGGAGGGTAGVAGSAVVETVITSTKAFVDQGAALTAGSNVNISASDHTTIGSFGGAVSFGGTAGVGAGAVVEVIIKDTEAAIKDSTTVNQTTVNAGQDLIITAKSDENITAAAASAAGGGTAGVAGSGVVYVITNNTDGYIGDNAKVDVDGSAAVSAQNDTTMNLLAGNVAVGGTAGVGGAAGVSVITKTTDAHIGNNALIQADGNDAALQVANGKFTTDTAYVPGTNEIKAPSTSGIDADSAAAIDVAALTKPVLAQIQAVRGVAVSAISRDTVRAGAVGASVGGTAGVQGSLGANVTVNTTKAYIDQGAKINTATTGEHADQSVLVAAGSDFRRLSTAGAFAGGGTAGVGGGTDTAVRVANTEAYIAKATQVEAKKDITVLANAAESIFSVTAVGAAGLNAGVAGSLAVNVLDISTKAYIEDGTNASDKAIVKAGNNVRIAAHDDTNIAVIAGGVGMAGLGAGVGGSVDVTIITKDTQAYAGKYAEVEALGGAAGSTQMVYAGTDNKMPPEGQRTTKAVQGLAIQATSEETIVDAVVAGGGAVYAGVAGTVVTNVITADTKAYIDNFAKVNAKDVSITAVDDQKLFSAAGSAGVGVGGVAGSFNVGVILGDTTAYIGAADVTAANYVDVNALSTKDIHVNTVSAGGGVVGVAGSASVLAIGGSLNDEARSYLNGDSSGSAQGDADSKARTNQAGAMVGGYNYTYTDKSGNEKNIGAMAGNMINDKTKEINVSGAVASNTIPVSPLPHGTAAVIREGAKINAGGDVALNARNNLKLQSAAGSATGGAGAFGGATNISVINHLTDAHIGSTAAVDAPGKISVQAAADENLNTVAISGSAGGFSVDGALNLNILNTSTKGYIGQAVKINQTSPDPDQEVIIKAADTTTVINVAGSASVGSGGVGAGLAMDAITKNTQAYIDSSTARHTIVRAGKNITVDAISKEAITNVAASGVLGGGGAAGAVLAETLNVTTKAFVGDYANLSADGNIRINAQDENTVNLVAGSAAVGGTGVGASAAAAVVTKITDAHVGQGAVLQANANSAGIDAASGSFAINYTAPTGEAKAPAIKVADQYLSKSDNKEVLDKERTAVVDKTTHKGVAVTAVAQDTIRNVAVGAAAGAADNAAGSGSVSVVTNTTTAYVADDAKINQSNSGATSGNQSVHIASATDYYHLGVGGAAAIGGGAGAGAGVDVSVVKNNTLAYVGKSAAVSAKNNINVTAKAAEEILSIAVAGAAGSTAGLAGALTVNTINNHTYAYLDELAFIQADNNIRLTASDDTRITALSGSAGLALGSAGVGGSIIVNTVTKDTQAEIGNGAQVDAKATGSDKMTVYDAQAADGSRTAKQLQGLSVEAANTENLFDVAASGGAGLYAGVAGAVAVNLLTVDTTAHIGSAKINHERLGVGSAQSVNVSAVDDLKLFSVGGSAAGGAVGVSGGVDVGIIKANTAASIGGGADVKAVKSVDVNALAKKDITSYAASVSGGLVGVAGGVSVYTIGSGLSSEAKSSLNSSGSGASHANAQGYVDSQLDKNAVGNLLSVQKSDSIQSVATSIKTDAIGITDSVNDTVIPGGVSAAIGNGSKIDTGGDVSVEAKQKVSVSLWDGGASIGGINAGAGVGIVSLKNDTTAFIDKNAIITNAGNIAVEAGLTQNATVKANAAAGGLIGGLGAAVAIINDDSDTTAYIGDAAQTQQAGTISVQSNYTGTANSEAIGAAAGGFLGAGAAVATANITGENTAHTGSIQVGQTGTVGSLSIAANTQATGIAKAVAGAAGLGAGAGANAKVKVAPVTEALIGNNAKINTTGNVSVQASGQGVADADALGISVGGLSVGVSVAKAENMPTVTAGIGSGSTFTIGGDLTVKAQQALLADQDAANANAVAAGGGLIGVNATVADAINNAKVTSYIGSSNTLTTINAAGNANITAETKTKQQAVATAATGGYLAVGSSISAANSNSNTNAYVDRSNITARNIGLEAEGTDNNFASTKAGSGGIVSGAAAVASTSAGGSTKAAFNDSGETSVEADKLSINAFHTTLFNAAADSTSAAAVGASGIKVTHTVDTDVLAAIGKNVTTFTKEDTTLKAVNTSTKDWRGDKTSGDKASWNLTAASGGIATGSAVVSDINVTHDAVVMVSDGSNITAGHGGTVGSFIADAASNITVRDKARINAGGAIAIADVDSKINAKGNTIVDIGKAHITSDTGKIKAGTKNNADIDNRVAADAYGVAGAPAGIAYSDFTGKNQVSIDDGARLVADHDISLAAGRDSNGAAGVVNSNAVVNLWNKTVVPINSKPNPKATITSNSTLAIDGYVGSANDIYLTADKGAMNASYTGVGKDLYREALAEIGSAISELFGGEPVNLDIKGGSKSTVGTANVAINSTGTVETGLKRVKELSIGGSYQSDGNGGYYWLYDPQTLAGENTTYDIVPNKAIAEGMTDRINELNKLKAAYAGDNKAVGAYEAEISFLQEKMVKMGLASWDTTGGGKVFVPGTSAGTGALSPKASAQASLTQMVAVKADVDTAVPGLTTIVNEAKTYRDLVQARDTANTALTEKSTALTNAQTTLSNYVNNTANFSDIQKPTSKADAETKRGNLSGGSSNPLYDNYTQAITYFGTRDTATTEEVNARTSFANSKTAITTHNGSWDQNIALSVVQTDYDTQNNLLGALTTQQTTLGNAITDLSGKLAANALSDEVPKGPTADYITIRPIIARLGDINISADNLTGTGKLVAPGDAKISITNESPAFLTVDDLTIRDGGRISFNGAAVTNNAQINAINSSKSGASFSNITTWRDTAKPSITIKSTFNPEAHKKPLLNKNGSATGKSIAIGIAPDITLAQGSLISNLNGSVTVKSNAGSIYSNGSISAGTVDIEAANGDFVQSYVDGFTHIGGDPEKIKKGLATPGGITANGSVFISARYLNVNGLIQSGIADWSLTLGSSNDIRVSINGGSKTLSEAESHAANNSSTGFYTVVGGYSGNIGDKGYVTYNARDKRFEVGGVEVHGGLVQLYGQIMNTAADGATSGRVRALDGYGKINITNTSGKDIVLQNLNTGEGLAGVIDITDTGRNNLRTVYTSLRGIVTVTEDGALKNNSDYNYAANGERGKLIYRPLGNMYYNWTTGKDSSVTKYYHYEEDDVFGITYSSSLVNKSSLTRVVYGKETPLPNGIYFSINKPFANSDSASGHTEVIKSGADHYHKIKEWTKRYWYTFGIAGTYYQDFSITTPNKNITTHSISTSNPIGIEFFGQNAGELTVNGNSGNVLLQGVLTNKEGTTSISAANSILQSDSSALISTKDLTLTAGQHVGTNDQAVRAVLIDGTLNASVAAANGSVNVTQVLGDLKLGNVNADNGTLRLTADGNIINAAVSDVRGQRVELVSSNGAIGTTSAPLIVKTGNTTNYLDASYGLKAYALNDINIENKTWTGKNAAGNLLIDTVESRTGDVTLKTPGQMIDNNTDEQIDRRTWDKLINYWDSLQLRSDTADNVTKQQQAIDSYINGKNAEYQTYWQLHSRIVDGKYVFAEGEQATLTAQGINAVDFGQAKVAAYQKLADHGVGSWNGGQYADGFKYIITTDEQKNLLKGSSWTDRELAISLAPGVLKQLTDTVPIVKAPNVKGKNVTLDAGNGIGSNLASIVINASILPQDLTPEQKVALAAAERADMVIDNDAKTISITQRKAINVEAEGLLKTTSGSHAYLGSESKVTLDKISALGDVRLKTAGDILAGNTGHVIVGNNIILESADGGIGTDAIPLNLGHSGTLTARAAKNINLYQDAANPDMKVDTIYSLQEISLTAAGNIQSSDDNEEGLNIMSKSLKLKAGTAIGSGAKALGISVDSKELDPAKTGKLSAEAQTGIHLDHIGDSLTVAKAETAAGNIDLTAATGSMTLQQINATTGSITAQAGKDISADQLSAAGNISLIASRDIAATNLTSFIDSVTMHSGNDITATAIKAGNAITSLAGNNLTANTLEAANNISLTATNGSMDMDTITATTGSITAQAGKDISADQLSAAGNISLIASRDIAATNLTSFIDSVTMHSGNDITATAIKAGNAITSLAGNNLTVNTLEAVNDISLTATNGSMDMDTITATTGAITAQAGKDISADQLSAAGNISLIASRDIAATNLTSFIDSVTMHSGNDITATAIKAGNAITSLAGNNLTANTLEAVNDISLTATNGSMDMDTITATTGSITAQAGKDISADQLSAAGNISLIASRDIAATNLTSFIDSVTMHSGNDITATAIKAGNAITYLAGNNLTANTLDAANDISLTATNGSMDMHAINATTGSITAQAGKDINADQLSAAGNIALTAGQDIHVIQIHSTAANLSLTADRSITNANTSGGINLTGNNLLLTANKGAIGAADKRVVVVIPGNVEAYANQDIHLEARSGDLNASNLVSQQGGIELLVTAGRANITRLAAPGGTVILGAAAGISLTDLEAQTLELNSTAAGSTLELGNILLGKSMTLTADNISINNLEHTGIATPLQLSMTGGSKNLADTINLTVSSNTGVDFTNFAADQANVKAYADNLSFLDTRIGSWANFRNNNYYVVANNLQKRLLASDLQIYPENNSFYLKMFADRRFLTNALAINYSPDFIVNSASNDNSLVKQTNKAIALSNTDHDGNPIPDAQGNRFGFNNSLPPQLGENAIQFNGIPLNIGGIANGGSNPDNENQENKAQ